MNKIELEKELQLLDKCIAGCVAQGDYARADRFSAEWAEVKIKLNKLNK